MSTMLSTSHVGPDDLHMPGMGKRLHSAAVQLDKLSKHLDGIASDITPHVDKDDRGFATRALSGLARRTRDALHGDSQQLDKLAEATRAEADLLQQVQGETLHSLRHQWHTARHHFVTEVEELNRRHKNHGQALEGGGHITHDGGGHHGGHHVGGHVSSDMIRIGGHHDAHALARHIEAEVVGEYDHIWNRYLGYHPANPGMQSMLLTLDDPIGPLMHKYRQTVKDVMESWADLVHRLNQLDDNVQHHVERRLIAMGHVSHGDGPDRSLISDPDALRELAGHLQHVGRRVGHAREDVEAIADDLRWGRMQPHDERDRKSNPFKHSWKQHLSDLAEDLHPVAKEAEKIADHMHRVDQEGGHTLRQLFRQND